MVGRDPRTDIALLKVESDEPLPFVEFGDSDAERVGDWVLAIGNPLGQGFSVSSGIVSARNRTLQGSYDDFIQTDAAINRGNSGGPLFNMDGEVIGVNTAILSPNGGSIGIGFAMSSAVVERVVAQLQDFGETRRGWLGVRIQNVDADMAEALGLEGAEGALVTDVPEGPAADAGLKAGDVITDLRRRADRGHARAGAHRRRHRGRQDGRHRHRARRRRPDAARSRSACSRSRRSPRPSAGGDEAAPAEEQVVLGLSVTPVTAEEREALGLGADVNGLVVTVGRGRQRRLHQGHARGRRDHRGRPGAGRQRPRRCATASRRPRRRGATRSCCWSAATARRGSWR